MTAQARRARNGAIRRGRAKASAAEVAKGRIRPAIDPKAGRLIAVEGVDGSGKSTQLHLLEQWLRHQNLKVFKTDWNSSETVKEITSRGKKKGLLTPTTFSLLHATDFADRYERNILPLLEAGYFVLADRYVFTAYARDIVRGCHPGWVRKIYSYAAKPDLTLYFRVPVDVAVSRILAGRPKLKYYEAGMDMNLSNDPYESYRIFQGRIVEQYESMLQSEGLVAIDANRGIEEQQVEVRERVTKLFDEMGIGPMTTEAIREHVQR
ncbi:MAG TPA: thymidylate kinase [Nitrososphaerales archaeon]|nr:thymidylate kinase [Nitrososphaerales archaeon]